ncbi:restriction endonuclease subunit S [uncultured Pseudoteredinibacter sp.]|uniref:restriction endonuclease subunit S n=1 Tax=uncultured Pseudoteredinibacter sp. TaxID=1641701 RepID=UPI00261D7044|nr:restriction endonuclease subunit S [uncultured Pseudoteredinibacter sp.]
MLPNNWKKGTIEDIAKVASGGTPSRGNDLYWGGDIPWVTTSEVRFGIISDTEQKITSKGLKHSSAKIFPKGTILIAMYGQGKTRGQVAKLAIEASTNQACAALQLYTGYDVDYYYQFLASQYENIRDLSNSGGQQNLSAGIIKNIHVPIPPLQEQQKIAKILSTWDQAITTTENLIKTSKQQKKALMQQLLTSKKRLTNPETGKAFERNWQSSAFGNIFKERVETGREDLPLLSITSNDGVVHQESTGRKNTSNEDKSKYRRICINDIGYNTMRMWQGRSSLSDKEGIVSPAYTIVTPSDAVCPIFASYLFKLPQLVHMFYRHSQGLVSDTWNLKFNHFKKIHWRLPQKPEQQKIASILTATDKEIKVLEAKISYLQKEKKALMQQLLTGKRRITL